MKTAALFTTAATALALLPAHAMAQTTGTIAIEEDSEAILVTGTRIGAGVEGIILPDTSKARAALGEEAIRRQTPGQSILDTINLLPGVSFQNNDPYGSAGGTLSVRGFSSDRVSLTFDGVPLNDSGNYAIYSNQQLDPEVIEQVNVSLGSTDVDSPTASAAGGTINYRTRMPGRDLGAYVAASYGDFDFHRLFGMIDTGEFTPFGTRAFVSASVSRNDNVFNDFGRIYKQQYNGRIYQPIGANGDFVSVAGHYNQNRNNFFGSVGLRNDRDVPGGFPQTRDERFYSIERCTVTEAVPGVRDESNSCGSTFDERFNPSNTGNIRGASRFTLADGLILTIDPSYQYVKANGGGTVNANEGLFNAGGTGIAGFIGGQYYFGRDLNGDGDTLDRVRLLAPSNTNTNRYGVAASLIYQLAPAHRVRLAYTWDRARHRQTGELDFLDQFGRPLDVFTNNNPLADVFGNIVQKRDRLSYAILHQVAGEYVGRFMDDRLTINAGLRAPFFTRELNQYCFTTSAGGFVDCVAPDQQAAYQAARPNSVAPTSTTYKYDKLLPNVGFTFDLAARTSLFANYARGLSVPSTDNLYNSLFFRGAPGAQPAPEVTDSFDLGIRHTQGMLQAQLAGWYTRFGNRTASSYDPELNETIFRNLGTVDKWGIDASIAVQPVPELVLYAFGSYLDSNIRDDIQTGVANGQPIFAPTSGKREAGSPTHMFGGRVQGMFGPVELGVQAKYTGPRYVYDTNEPVLGFVGGQTVELFDAKVPGYTSVDLDARLSLGLENTYLQLNVTNLFDKLYVGGFGGGLNQVVNRNAAGAVTGYGNPPFVQIGAPRTVSASLVIGF